MARWAIDSGMLRFPEIAATFEYTSCTRRGPERVGIIGIRGHCTRGHASGVVLVPCATRESSRASAIMTSPGRALQDGADQARGVILWRRVVNHPFRPFSGTRGLIAGVLPVLVWLGACDDGGEPTITTPPVATGGGQFGSVLDTAEYDSSPETLPPFAFGSGEPGPLPSRVVLTNLPAVSMQGTPQKPGSPGTCEAQAFGYGLGSYTAARRPNGEIKWNPADPANTASAAFLFALAIARGDAVCPRGGKALIYLQRLIAAGAPSTRQVPYAPTCQYIENINLNQDRPGEARFRIGSYSTFRIHPDQRDLIKRLLAAGHAIAFSGLVYEHYATDPRLEFGVFGSNTDKQPRVIPNSGHGQLIVGYDDSKGDPSAPGAFLIQNSFGTEWPPTAANPDGRIWWAYETFFRSQKLAAVAYPRADSVPPQGELDSSESRPRAFVTGVQQWVRPDSTSQVYLIIELQFTEPVMLESIAVTEPGTGAQLTQSYHLPFSTGYVFFRRIDGAQFVNGRDRKSVV